MIEIAILTLATWVTYYGAIKNNFVSDDIDAILKYDGEFRGWDYGNLTKWIFYRLFQKDPKRNHIFPIVLHNANAILLYVFLSTMFSPTLAFYTALLFVVHPIGTQAVAWISARGYPLGLFWLLLYLNVLSLNNFPTLFISSPLTFSFIVLTFVILYFLGVHAQFTVMMSFILLAYMGNYFLAMIGLGMAVVMGTNIVKEVIGIRKKVFKDQNMGASAKLTPQKFVLAMKTLWYYTRLCFFPKRMGLYHIYGYLQTPEMLKEDRIFWQGFILAIVMGLGLYYGNAVVRFGILWWLTYILIFLNWITIHQFVTERYCYIANIGLCLLLAYALQNYPIVLAFVVGLYMMRIWVHLPTYEDEVPFYQSNIWNFPASEVAFANLGVVYIKRGLIGSAMDMWAISLKINKDYDVAFYNISSTLKSRGQLQQAYDNLKKAVNSPTCHFKELWSKELQALAHEIEYVGKVTVLREQLVKLKGQPTADIITNKLEHLQQMHKQIEQDRQSKFKVMQQKQKELETQIITIIENQKAVANPINPQQLIQLRDNTLKTLEDEARKL